MIRNIEVTKIKVVRILLRGCWRPTFAEGKEKERKQGNDKGKTGAKQK